MSGLGRAEFLELKRLHASGILSRRNVDRLFDAIEAWSLEAREATDALQMQAADAYDDLANFGEYVREDYQPELLNCLDRWAIAARLEDPWHRREASE